MAKGSYARIILATADLDGAFERLRDAGSQIAQEPTEQPCGVRDLGPRPGRQPHQGQRGALTPHRRGRPAGYTVCQSRPSCMSRSLKDP